MPPPTPRPPAEIGLNVGASSPTLGKSNPNQNLSREGNVDLEGNGKRIKEAGVCTSTNSVAAQTISASPAQLSSRPTLGKTADSSSISRRYGLLYQSRSTLQWAYTELCQINVSRSPSHRPGERHRTRAQPGSSASHGRSKRHQVQPQAQGMVHI